MLLVKSPEAEMIGFNVHEHQLVLFYPNLRSKASFNNNNNDNNNINFAVIFLNLLLFSG